MKPALTALLALGLALPAMAQDDPAPVQRPPDSRNYVAVVIGLSSYASLPDEVELDFGRSDAAMVAKTLREDARFDEVFLLGDGEAKKEQVEELLRTQVAQLVGPNDVFILYFAGHGIGADLDLPVLLAHDSTLENGQEDGLELQRFARDLQTWTRAGTALIVTDAIHRNQLDGIYFYGPAADQWPRMPQGTMIISSSQKETPATDGAFGKVFAQGLGGQADSNRDQLVTASELFTYLVNSLSPSGQIPVASGDFESTMVLAQDVTSPEPKEPEKTDTDEPDEPDEPPPPPEPKVIYPDYPVAKAKFVFSDGAAQTVQCREQPVMACAPSCYVRNFKAGPCGLTAVFEGVPMQGEAVVLSPGMYNCHRKGSELVCEGP